MILEDSQKHVALVGKPDFLIARWYTNIQIPLGRERYLLRPPASSEHCLQCSANKRKALRPVEVLELLH